MQALEVAVVLERHVVVHGDVAIRQPGRRALDRAGAVRVQAHQPAPRRRMGRERELLHRVDAAGRGAFDDDQRLVGLPDRLAGPAGQRVVDHIGDQLVFVLDRVEPARHRRIVGRLAREQASHVGVVDDQALAGLSKNLGEALVEGGRDRRLAAGDHRDGARDADAPAAGAGTGAGVGGALGERGEQRLVDRRHVARDALERRPIELEHDRVARCRDGGAARSAREESELADRLAHPDLVDRLVLALDPDLEPARHDHEHRVGRRVLANQNLAPLQAEDLRLRPDGGQLLVRQLTEDRGRAKQFRGVQRSRIAWHCGPLVPPRTWIRLWQSGPRPANLVVEASRR